MSLIFSEKDSVHGWKCFLCDLNPRSAASSSSPERSEYTSELGNKDGCIGLDASQACGERCQQMENAPYTECGKSRVDTCLRRLGGSYRAKAKYKMERNRKTVAKHISTVFGPSSDGKGHGLKIRISRLLLKPKQVISTFDVEPVELGSGRKFPIRVVPYLSEQSTSNTISTRLRVSPSDLQNKNLNTVWEDFGPGILLLTCDDGCNPHLTFRIPPHNIVHISLRSNPEAVPVVKFQFPNLVNETVAHSVISR
uniref:Uncharacterized protein n=1 Tax=Spongospora subterranea TaxID=70186 RepID=A0A0H5RTN8_9EUKA|eukprot:CRZ12109.1 hypothetical protein [Spongospora subterranea]